MGHQFGALRLYSTLHLSLCSFEDGLLNGPFYAFYLLNSSVLHLAH